MDFVKDESFSEEMLFWRVLLLLLFTIAAPDLLNFQLLFQMLKLHCIN